ncbi:MULTISPECIES: ABC transporter permease subunit [Heyndrickxia]|uniref:ABC transporter permease subunit n=1 Tax=Heyndrickxia TaxID=2837504 RepID=UPI001B1B4EC2|nr:ABC transporter permease subunit [Heyndrickxia oleronia]GIN37376.1 membrane protein [Heyndrickxia oleronia]
MNIVKKILSQAILWLITFSLLVVFMLLPRDVEYESGEAGNFIDAHYVYKIDSHIKQIKEFYHYITHNPGLGKYRDNITNIEHITDKVLKSMWIIIPALFLSLIVGIAKGIFDYWSKDKKASIIGKGSTWLFLSIPDLFIIISLQLSIIALYEMGWIPHIKIYGSDSIDNYIICILFLSIYPFFYVANITYTSFKEEESNDYIRTAKSKGIHTFKILYIHILKNCMPTILSHTNTVILYILSNLFIVERLTDFRGAAFYFWESVRYSPMFAVGQQFAFFPVDTIGFIFYFTIIIFFANTISNIVTGWTSPNRKADLEK